MRHGMELPNQLAGHYIVRTQVSRRRQVVLATRRSHDDEILKNLSDDSRLNLQDRLLLSPQSVPEVDHPFLPKGQDGQASSRINRLEIVVVLNEEPPIGAVFALPVDRAPRGQSVYSLKSLVYPDLLAGRRIQCDKRVVPGKYV